MIHENSDQSYAEQKEKGSTNSWRRKVFDAFSDPANQYPRTDRSMIEQLKAKDFNLIRPEITRLIHDGLLREEGKTKCMWTGKTVRTCIPTGKPYFEKGNKKHV